VSDIRDDSEWETVERESHESHESSDPTGSRQQPDRPRRAGSRRETADGRRLVAAGNVLLAVLIGIVLALFLNAAGIKKTAESLPFGAQRSVAVALARPIATVSHFFYIDRPNRIVRDALGKGSGEDDLGSQLADLGKPTDGATPGVLRTPTRKEPLRCWVGGDSMTQVFGQSLVNMMRKTRVMKATLDYRISTGLSRPDYFDWPAHLRFVVDKTRPDVIVIMFGANDGQGVEFQGKVLDFGTPAWVRLYHRRVGEAMDIAMNDGFTKVYWVGQPITRLDDFNPRLQLMNTVYEQEAAKRPALTFVPTWDLFTDGSGKYSAYLRDDSGKLQLMRQGDGIHLSLIGGDRMAAPVLKALRVDAHLEKP
jgi:hypothetical protein